MSKTTRPSRLNRFKKYARDFLEIDDQAQAIEIIPESKPAHHIVGEHIEDITTAVDKNIKHLANTMMAVSKEPMWKTGIPIGIAVCALIATAFQGYTSAEQNRLTEVQLTNSRIDTADKTYVHYRGLYREYDAKYDINAVTNKINEDLCKGENSLGQYPKYQIPIQHRIDNPTMYANLIKDAILAADKYWRLGEEYQFRATGITAEFLHSMIDKEVINIGYEKEMSLDNEYEKYLTNKLNACKCVEDRGKNIYPNCDGPEKTNQSGHPQS